MNQYKKFLGRTDLVKNQVEREKLAEQEASDKRKRSIQQQNKQRWLKYQEQLRSELAARYFHSVISAGGDADTFSNTKSLNFDGTDAYLEGSSNYTLLDGQSKATFSAWIKAGSLTSQSYLFAIGGSTTVFQVAARLQSISATDARVWFYIGDASNSARAYANLGSIKNDGQWHHLMICMDLVTFSSFDEVDFFLDGNLLTTNGYYNPTSLVNSATALAIGNRENPNTGLMVGSIDEFAIWSGTDLRASAATIYNDGVPSDLNNNDLTAPTTWFRMGDEATVVGDDITIPDQIGTYDLTSEGMVAADVQEDTPGS